MARIVQDTEQDTILVDNLRATNQVVAGTSTVRAIYRFKGPPRWGTCTLKGVRQ